MATSSPTKRRSRVFTISMPPEMAASAEALAKQENRSMSELLREAFRAYHSQRIGGILDEIGRYAAARNPNRYTEKDVDRLVHEVRAEMRAERKTRPTPAAR
jgi:Arc/MetJ-type ribon-helix-helix transcriptional regulator